MPAFFESIWFWNTASFLSGFAITYWLLKKPLPFLVLLALIGALYFLFGEFAMPGFVCAAFLRAFWPKKIPERQSGKAKRKRFAR